MYPGPIPRFLNNDVFFFNLKISEAYLSLCSKRFSLSFYLRSQLQMSNLGPSSSM